MKKTLIFVVIVLLLTGCSVNGNLSISKDGSISENINIIETKAFLSEYGISEHDYIEGYKNMYASNLHNYSYSDNSDKNNMKYDLNNEYKNICDYFNKSDSIKIFFSDITCDENEDRFIVHAKTNYFKCAGECLEPPVVDDVSLKINSSLKVLDENANEKEGSTYTWNFSDGSNDVFSLTLQKNQKDIIRNKINNVTSNKKVIVLSILGAIGILALVVLILMNKYKKNKIDY